MTPDSKQKAASTPLVRAYIFMAVAIFSFAFAANFVRLSQTNGIPSYLIASGRLLIATLILTPPILARYLPELKRLSLNDLLWTFAAGFWLGVYSILLIVSLEYTSVLINQVLVNTSPIWVALMEVNFLKARMSRGIWLGLSLTIIGGIIIAGSGILSSSNTENLMGDNPLLGIALAMIGAVTLGLYLIIGRRVRPKVSVLPYTWLVYVSGSITTFIVVAVTNTPIFGHSAMGYFWLLMLAIVAHVVGYLGFNNALGYMPATIVSTSAQLVVVLSAIVAFFLFGEIPTVFEFIGSTVIIVGVIYAIINKDAVKPKLTKVPD